MNGDLITFGLDEIGEAPAVDPVTIEIDRAAARHLAAFSADQRVRALHESGHAVVATVLGIPVKAIDIRGRYAGHTETGEGDDDLPETETASRLLDRIVVALAGLAAEELVIGEGTTGGGRDLELATSLALDRVRNGLDPDAPFVSIDAFGFGTLPGAISDAVGTAVVATLARCRERAATLVERHRQAIIVLATRLYQARRLTDDDLVEVLRAAGLEPRVTSDPPSGRSPGGPTEVSDRA